MTTTNKTKEKLMASMRKTKEGSTQKAAPKKEAPKKAAPKKKTTAQAEAESRSSAPLDSSTAMESISRATNTNSYQSRGCRIWPD